MKLSNYFVPFLLAKDGNAVEQEDCFLWRKLSLWPRLGNIAKTKKGILELTLKDFLCTVLSQIYIFLNIFSLKNSILSFISQQLLVTALLKMIFVLSLPVSKIREGQKFFRVSLGWWATTNINFSFKFNIILWIKKV